MSSRDSPDSVMDLLAILFFIIDALGFMLEILGALATLGDLIAWIVWISRVPDRIAGQEDKETCSSRKWNWPTTKWDWLLWILTPLALFLIVLLFLKWFYPR